MLIASVTIKNYKLKKPVIYTFNIQFIGPVNIQWVRETEKSEH